jgi:hypothetical protein
MRSTISGDTFANARRLATTLGLGVCLLGCGSLPPDQVKLAIAENARPGCYLTFYVYDLVADPNYGTAIRYELGESAPLFWPPGFTGHRVGSEVEVWDPNGKVVAMTGGRYAIWPADDGTWSDDSGLIAGCINQVKARIPPQGPTCNDSAEGA